MDAKIDARRAGRLARAAVAVAALWAFAACRAGEEPSRGAAPTDGGAALAPVPRSSAVAQDPICVAIESETRAILAAATNACTSASDCACTAPVPGSPCGGVHDKKTATSLGPLATRWRAGQCSNTQCAAWACEPKCENGTCRR